VCDRVMVELSKDIVGQYEILEKIREGGMGAIYKVRHRVLDQVRIIKMMRSKLKGDSLLKRRFENEARTAARLRHDNIAQLFDFALDDEGNAFMVLEYIDGFDLDEILEAFGPPPVTLCVEIASQCLDALDYLHRRGIIHRDISPDNLMVSRNEEGLPVVKLIDLGVAKVLRDQGHQTREGTFLGKLRYASPEQLGSNAENPVDHRTDLYSFGVVLYELLTGQHPVRGDSAQALVAGHLTRPPIPFSETDPGKRINPALREVVLRALAKDPEDRFANAREFRDAMVQAQPGSPLDLSVFASWFQKRAEKQFRGATAEFSSTQHRLDRQFEAARKEAARASSAVRQEVSGSTGEPVAGGEYEEERTASLASPLRSQLRGLIEKARAAADERRFDQAEMLLRRAGDLIPNDPELLEAESLIREKRRQRREAMARARKIARGIHRIEALLAAGDIEKADETLQALRATVGHSDDMDRISALIREKWGDAGRIEAAPADDKEKSSGSRPEEPEDVAGSTRADITRKRVFRSLLEKDEASSDRVSGRDNDSEKRLLETEFSRSLKMMNELLATGKLVAVGEHLQRLEQTEESDTRLDAFRERFEKIREEYIGELIREIDTALSDGDQARARERLEEGEELDNEHPGILAARRKLLRLEEKQQKLDALKLLLDRRELEEAGRLIESESAVEEDPGWQGIRTRYRQLKAFEDICSLKNSGRFEEALQLLLGLEERDSEIFGGLETEIREAVRRHAALQKLLDGAEDHAGRKEYETAIELLEEAMNLDPKAMPSLLPATERGVGSDSGEQLVDRVQERLDSGDFPGAMELLDAVDPALDKPELTRLRKKLQTLQRHRRRIEGEIKHIRTLFAGGGLREAADRVSYLRDSESVISTLELTGGKKILEELAAGILETFAQLENHLVRARTLMKDREYGAAYDELNRGLLIAPGDPVVEELLEETGRELRRIAEEKRRSRKNIDNGAAGIPGEVGTRNADEARPEEAKEASTTSLETVETDVPEEATPTPIGEKTLLLGPDQLPGPSDPVQEYPPASPLSDTPPSGPDETPDAAGSLAKESPGISVTDQEEEQEYAIPIPGLIHDLVWPARALPRNAAPGDGLPISNNNPPIRVSFTLSAAQPLDLVSAALLLHALDGNVLVLPVCRTSIRCSCSFDDPGHVDFDLKVQPLPDDQQILSRGKRNLLRTQTKKAVIRMIGRLKKMTAQGGKIEKRWPLESLKLHSGADLQPKILCFGLGPEQNHDGSSCVFVDTAHGQPLQLEIEAGNRLNGYLLFPFHGEALLWVADLPHLVQISGAES